MSTHDSNANGVEHKNPNGADHSTPQSFSVHVTSPTLSTSGSFNLFNFACASSSNAATACDSDQTSGDNNNKITVIGACVLGYPFTSSNPRTSVAFNESAVLRTFRGSASNIQMFYNDEHAMTLGANTNGFTTTPFAAEYPKPSTTTNVAGDAGPAPPENPPALSTGDPNAVDPSARPEFPSLFVTDITADPSATPASHTNVPAWNDGLRRGIRLRVLASEMIAAQCTRFFALSGNFVRIRRVTVVPAPTATTSDPKRNSATFPPPAPNTPSAPSTRSPR